MLKLARWHAPDTCARVPSFTASCRPIACSAPYFRTPSTQQLPDPSASDLAIYISIARSPPLKTHRTQHSWRTRQRLTSYDFIESARRSTPVALRASHRRALPIKIWRDSSGAFPLRTSRSQIGLHHGTLWGVFPLCTKRILGRAVTGAFEDSEVCAP